MFSPERSTEGTKAFAKFPRTLQNHEDGSEYYRIKPGRPGEGSVR